METKGELAKAIVAVMQEVKGIEKNMSVGTGQNSYKGVADQDVKKIVGDAMQKHGLCILPIDIDPKMEVSRWEAEYNGSKQQKQSVFTEVTARYLLLHTSGESQVITGYGHGVDSQDKGAGKATTYALKYALLYTFLVPTGKIDDTDNTHTDQHEVPATKVAAPIPNGKKKPLEAGTPAYTKAVDFIATGGSWAQVERTYFVSPEIKKAINEEARTAA